MNQFDPSTLAKTIVHETGSNLFLTGKAGTGKTTFLREIIQETTKNHVILAPTGVAAINAGGMTIHSFFQLPFSTYIKSGANGAVSKYMLLKNLRLSEDKIELIKNLQLIIIDEISMVRADSIDAIDDILRFVRNKPNEAFGGTQMLFIGDLFQLPPVVKDDEANLLTQFYASPFFFDATVMQLAPFKTIELNKIYRQQDASFIDLLNKIRNNECKEAEFELLKNLRKKMPDPLPKGTIVLCSHNAQADAINRSALDNLDSSSFKYHAKLSGNFNEKNAPADLCLELKVGAQVMFTKNDLSGEQRYFNGKIATVSKLSENEIFVLFDQDEEFEVNLENWTNQEYIYDEDEDKIQKKELGKFTQYPLKLAWAITIHKSQGLTFNEVLIDAGKSFAAGQVYVALSRCTHMAGLGLLSDLNPGNIISDPHIVKFLNKQIQSNQWLEELELEKKIFAIQTMNEAFSMNEILQLEHTSISQLQKLSVFEQQNFGKTWKKIQQTIAHLDEMAEKFKQLMNYKIKEEKEDSEWIQHKVLGAKKYFIKELSENVLDQVQNIKTEASRNKRIKGLSKILDRFRKIILLKRKKIAIASLPGYDLKFNLVEEEKETKPVKGETKLITKDLFLSGMNIREIAKNRNMAESTIEGHIVDLILTNQIHYKLFISDEEIERIQIVKKANDFEGLKPLFEALNGEFSYGKLKVAINIYNVMNILS
ncbi:MAG: helix-turn-helix domain-containing protein [Bacteroidia bacterium]